MTRSMLINCTCMFMQHSYWSTLICHFVIIMCSIVPTHHPQKEKSLVDIERFLGAQDAACHVIVMTTHRFGMAMHRWLLRAAIVCYSTVSHDNLMQATCLIGATEMQCQQASVSTRCVPNPFLLLGVGSGDETT